MLHPRLWQDDKSTTQCGSCTAAFSFFRRRHHCRHCGGVFCDTCTEQRVWLRPWPTLPPSPASPLQQQQQQQSSGRLSPSQTPPATRNNSLLSESSEQFVPSGRLSPPTQSTVSLATSVAQPSPTTFVLRSGAVDAAPTTTGGPATTSILRSAAGLPLFPPPPRESSRTSPATVAANTQKAPTTAAAANDRSHSTGTSVCSPLWGSSGAGLTASSAEVDSRVEERTGAGEPTASDTFLCSSTSAATTGVVCRPPAADPNHSPAMEGNTASFPAVAPPPAVETSENSQQPHQQQQQEHNASIGRRVSSAFFSSSVYAVSPTTVMTGDVTPQTWATPGPTSALERVASLQWPHGATNSVGSGESLPESRSAYFARSPQNSSNVMMRSDSAVGSRGNRRSPLVATAAASTTYREASYKTEVDPQHITWYLCRVCHSCYETLLDSILDAHEHQQNASPPPAPVTAHLKMGPASAREVEGSNTAPAVPPLWRLVRLSSTASVPNASPDLRSSALNSNTSPATSGAILSRPQGTPTAALSAGAVMPRLSSAWARLRTTVSLPASPMSSSVNASTPTSAMAPASLPPPVLRPRDLRRTRGSSMHSAQQNSPFTSPVAAGAHAQQPQPESKRLAATAGAAATKAGTPTTTAVASVAAIPGLPTRLYGPVVTSASNHLYGSPPPSSGLGCDDSILSVSSASFLPIPQTSSSNADQQLAPHQQPRRTRAAVTPPRRRLISIDNTANHLRRAVAIARRRRRIAVILIDEREPVETGEESPKVGPRSRCGASLQDVASGRVGGTRHTATLSPDGVVVSASTTLFFSPCASPAGEAALSGDFSGLGESGTPQHDSGDFHRNSGAAAIATPVGVSPADTAALERRHGSPPPAVTAAAPAPQLSAASQPRQAPGAVKRDPRGATAGGAASAENRPALSILVDLEEDEDPGCVLHGLPPGDWLHPALPQEAALPAATHPHQSPGTTNTPSSGLTVHAGATAAGGFTSPSNAASSSAFCSPHGSPASPTVPAPVAPSTSRPISCATATTPHAPTGSQVHQHQQRQQQQQQMLPALPLTPECGACVLHALLREVGAVSHVSAAPPTPMCTTPTPTSAAAAAAAAAGVGTFFPLGMAGSSSSGVFADPMLTTGGAAQAGWGTGPESYAAQRQALVRDMLLRQQQQQLQQQRGGVGAAAATGLTSPLASSLGALFSVGNLPATATTATTAAAATTSPRIAGLPAQPQQQPQQLQTHERVTATVNTFFQLRSPADTVPPAPQSTSTAASSSGMATALNPAAAMRILPVATQVEVVGIAVDASAATINRSPQTLLLSSAASSTHFPGLRAAAAALAANAGPSRWPGGPAGAGRPFTFHEFLPQLAKLSTTLDGYVIVVLRCGRRTRPFAATSSTGSPRQEADDGSPGLSSTRLRPRRDSIPASTTKAGAAAASIGAGPPHNCVARNTGNNTTAAVDEERCPSCSTSCLIFGSASPSSPLRLSSGAAVPASVAPNTRDSEKLASSSTVRCRRHRVTEPFGGPQLRQLYQQLQSCGVSQPAISVVDVMDDSVSDVETSPGSTASRSSPLGERNPSCEGVAASRPGDGAAPQGAALSPREMWHPAAGAVARVSPAGSALSASAISPVSSPSSPARQVYPAVPAAQRHNAAAASTASALESSHRPTPQDSLEKLELPSSLQHSVRHERLASAEFSSPVQATVPTPTAVATAVASLNKREAQFIAAQEHAVTSLRATARQLGLPVSALSYPGPATSTAAAGANSGGSSIAGAGGGTAPAEWLPLRKTYAAAVATPSPLASAKSIASGSSGSGGATAASNSNSNNSSAPLLMRGLESLVATMVYRDLSAQQ